jgi:hypothetical protein
MADHEITLADVYHRIGGLEAKVEQSLELEPRVRSLETSRARAYGAAGIISAAIAFVSNYFLPH